MNELSINFRDLPNIGVVELQVPADVMIILKTSIKKMMEDQFANSIGFQEKLVGHIANEYVLDQECRNALEPLVVQVSKLYDEKWNYSVQTDNGALPPEKPVVYGLQSLWVNLQKKHEFNPAHTHTGIYSFVIWMRIPYKLPDEEATFSTVPATSQKTSRFTFHYSNILGMHTAYGLPVDQDWEGKMLFFPAALTHSVYPFYTSDEYRISVAGNIKPIINNETD
jgi:hypothetical protein